MWEKICNFFRKSKTEISLKPKSMELSEFISKTLVGIASGIQKAQPELARFNSCVYTSKKTGNCQSPQDAHRMQKKIKFDLTITSEQREWIAGSISSPDMVSVVALDASVEANQEKGNSSVGRISFEIDMVYPMCE